MIPLYIHDEHNEALINWCDAIQKGYIRKKGNTLIHIDEHSDMTAPQFNYTIDNLPNRDMGQIISYVQNEVGIAHFIVPACHLGIFDKVYWVRRPDVQPKKVLRKKYVRTYNQEGKKFIYNNVKRNSKVTMPEDPDRADFNYFVVNPSHLSRSKNIVLDIDIDYFSCSGNPNMINPIKIGITEHEYNKFLSDPYHRLRFCNFARIEVLKENGDFFCIFNRFDETYPSGLKVDEQIIEQRIDFLIQQLELKKIKPRIIDICRSRFSGYTPHDQWEKIEFMLLKKLKRIYDYRMV